MSSEVVVNLNFLDDPSRHVSDLRLRHQALVARVTRHFPMRSRSSDLRALSDSGASDVDRLDAKLPATADPDNVPAERGDSDRAKLPAAADPDNVPAERGDSDRHAVPSSLHFANAPLGLQERAWQGVCDALRLAVAPQEEVAAETSAFVEVESGEIQDRMTADQVADHRWIPVPLAYAGYVGASKPPKAVKAASWRQQPPGLADEAAAERPPESRPQPSKCWGVPPVDEGTRRTSSVESSQDHTDPKLFPGGRPVSIELFGVASRETSVAYNPSDGWCCYAQRPRRKFSCSDAHSLSDVDRIPSLLRV